jgi:hypothetical protein
LHTRKSIALGIVLLFALAGVSVMISAPVAASDLPSSREVWAGYHPGTQGVYDIHRSLTTSTSDSITELSLSLTVDDLVCQDVIGGRESTITLNVAALANSRRAMDYIPAYSTSTTLMPSLKSSKSGLGDDAGWWQPLPSGYKIPYYGCWYDYLWITTNGVVQLATKATYPTVATTTSGAPTIPSTALPNILVAPYWKDMTVTGQKAKIYYGITGAGSASNPYYYVVCWSSVLDKGSTTAVNSFSVWFAAATNSAACSVGTTQFRYGTVSSSGSIRVGIENQDGNGRIVPPDTTDNKYTKNDVIRLTNSVGNYYKIRSVKIEAIEVVPYGEGGNDPNARVWIDGYYASGSQTYPGGANIEYFSLEPHHYSSDAALLSALSLGFGYFALITPPPVSFFCGAAGMVLALPGFMDSLVPTDKTEMIPSTWGSQTAYTKNLANDQNMPNLMGKRAWEVCSIPRFHWVTRDNTGPHGLYVKETVEYQYSDGSSLVDYQIHTNALYLQLYPSDGRQSSWGARTNPDGRPIDFSLERPVIESVEREGYSIAYYKGSGSSTMDRNFIAMGWSPTVQGSAYTIRQDSTLCVDGYFRMWDDIPAGVSLPETRKLDLYVLDVNDETHIIKTVHVLTSSDPMDQWVYKQIVIDQLYGYGRVKMGIGRPVWPTGFPDFSCEASWASVSVFERKTSVPTPYDQYGIHVSITGSGDVHSGSASGPSAIGSFPHTKGDKIDLYPVAATNFAFDHWEIGPNGQNAGSSNPYTISSISSDWQVRAVFTSTLLCLTIGGPISHVTPMPGTYYYSPGTVVTVTADAGYQIGNYYYLFAAWYLDGVLYSTSRSIQVTMNANHNVNPDYDRIFNPPE